MEIIKNIRVLKGAAVLAERKAGTPSLDLRRYNLIYGFNGSGKSTLSRVFAALQMAKNPDHLPAGCLFEIEMTDGATYTSPHALSGVEKRVCVFNTDFINENLRWEDGAASPVFHIGAEQADVAEKLKALEASLPVAKATADGDEKVRTEREKAFTEFKRNLARTVSERLRQASRYEATQLLSDIEKLGIDATTRLTDAELDAAAATCARSDAPAKISLANVPTDAIRAVVDAAATLGLKSIGSVVVDGLDIHPSMVPWVRQGHEYHIVNGLTQCLHCGQVISADRKALLTNAFDDALTKFIEQIDEAVNDAVGATGKLAAATAAIPVAAQLSAEFQPPFEEAAAGLEKALDEVSPLLVRALAILKDRQATPTTPIVVTLPEHSIVEQRIASLEARWAEVNAICEQHAAMVEAFSDHQAKAREAIRRHYIATSASDFEKYGEEIDDAASVAKTSLDAFKTIVADMNKLRSEIQQHGPAATKINALVASYLGHGELTIVPVAEGYELHRHGKLVQGMPSEGEKTAIALCYFLSTLEAEDRKLKDLIVVIDDPVSSLDTKAMNFACGLVRNRIGGAAQLIVLTHNQNCMGEFKKPWKGKTRNDDPTKITARLLFIDVTVPEATKVRTATLVELPKHLRDYEAEYHYLVNKVLAFELAGAGHFDYAFMMPNVLRRVLETFLAFKVPRNGPIQDKLSTVCERHPALDKDRVIALERLCQVESHSDSLDDLIALSSMTIEEGRDANAAVLHLMQVLDADHLADLRKYCKP